MIHGAGQVRIYLACGATYFSLYALMLTFVPVFAARNGASPSAAGLLILVIAISSLAADLTVASIAGRVGLRNTILLGVCVVTIGTAFVFTLPHISGTVLASAVLGIGFSLTATPILSGLATFAKDGQVRAQSINAGWQRAGALVAAVFLVDVLTGGVDRWVVLAAAVLLATVLTISRSAGEAPGTIGVERERPVPWHSVLSILRTSQELRLALLPSMTTTMLIVGGASFFPFHLASLHEGHLLTPTLIAREVAALAVLPMLARIADRRRLGAVWTWLVLAGASGMVITTLSGHPALLVAGFALHGGAISAGIVLGNAMIYDATEIADRTSGIAAGGAANRLTVVALPLVLAAALSVSTKTMVFTIALLCIVPAAAFHALIRRKA